MHKPVRAPVQEDDLPSLNSDDEDEDSYSSAPENEGDALLDDSDGEYASSASLSVPQRRRKKDSDEEMPYETLPRKRRPSWELESDQDKAIERLPIKTTDGRIQKNGEKIILRNDDSESEASDVEEEAEQYETQSKVEDVATGARFGRPAVVDIVGRASRKARIQGAQEQIASICQEILSDPENSVRCITSTPNLWITSVAHSSVFLGVCIHSLYPRYQHLRIQNLLSMIFLYVASRCCHNLPSSKTSFPVIAFVHSRRKKKQRKSARWCSVLEIGSKGL